MYSSASVGAARSTLRNAIVCFQNGDSSATAWRWKWPGCPWVFTRKRRWGAATSATRATPRSARVPSSSQVDPVALHDLVARGDEFLRVEHAAAIADRPDG